MQFIGFLADLIFIFDLIVNFYAAFYNKNDELVVDKKLIAKNYLRGWFFLDFIASIPFDILFGILSKNDIISTV